ncbi:MAG: AAA family ATPase [Magnetococcales bacterium]|nr:AAA family ATPase [Magnetococcales bacterium]
MLDSLHIANFRLFRELKIKRLGMVNLFSGKNGSGKSCLLEAVYIYEGNADYQLMLEMATSRNEDQFTILQNTFLKSRSNTSPLFHFFRDRTPLLTGSTSISIGGLSDSNKLEIYLERINGEYHFTSKINKKTRRISPAMNHPDTKWPINSLLYQPPRSLQFVSSHGLSSDKTKTLWDEVNLTDYEHEVVRALVIINPRITGIALIGATEDPNERIPVVRLDGSSERTPLRSLGDGAVRILHIILAMVNAKDGVLLLDEAENGLHWSVQQQLWKIIFHLSKALNIQVFATTHSKDCIAGFQEAWQENPEEGAFFRLDADPEVGARVTPYSLKTLGNALESQVEMR